MAGWDTFTCRAASFWFGGKMDFNNRMIEGCLFMRQEYYFSNPKVNSIFFCQEILL